MEAKRPRPRSSEAQEQEALFQWAALYTRQHPELAYLLHVPNGGHRLKAVAARLQRLGVKPGVPDLFLPVARRGYFGLWIELKVGRRPLSPAQADWVETLLLEGYRVEVCYGWQEAAETLRWYLDGRPTWGREGGWP